MYRKIHIYYSGNNENVTIIVTEENKSQYECSEIEYNINKYKNWIDLYNQTLDDFNAEYDEEITDGLETLCRQFWKEKEKCDSVIQE